MLLLLDFKTLLAASLMPFQALHFELFASVSTVSVLSACLQNNCTFLEQHRSEPLEIRETTGMNKIQYRLSMYKGDKADGPLQW